MKAKIKGTVAKKSNVSANELPARPMMPLEQCRAIMNKHGLEYTDEELLTMRAFMYQLAEIMTAYYDRKKANEAKVITLNKDNDDDKTESISLRPGEYGRTG